MDPLLASIYGGVLVGLSMGLLLNVGATTGGTEGIWPTPVKPPIEILLG